MADLYIKINFNLQHDNDPEEQDNLLEIALRLLRKVTDLTADEDPNTHLAFISGDDLEVTKSLSDIERRVTVEEIHKIREIIFNDEWPWEVAIDPEDGDPI